MRPQIEIIDISQGERWNRIVKSFKNYDVYYLYGYGKGFQIHGDGHPILIYYKSAYLRGICVFLKRDISCCKYYEKTLMKQTYFDLVTPYGYGGFLFEGEVNESSLLEFNKYYISVLQENGIICEFVRYHPLLKNAMNMKDISTVIELGNTVVMDLFDNSIIWNNISSNNRNIIRKAMKNGVTIHHEKGMSILSEFKKIYEQTMIKDSADVYYLFNQDFYDSIFHDLYDNHEVFYAVYNNIIIAASIILFANDMMHYHLSGSLYGYRHLAPTNLLLYEAACWGSSMGFNTFHLGGGLGSVDDSIFKFKKAFNKHSNNKFSIGTRIVDKDGYNMLIQKRMEIDTSFDLNSTYFPLYRT